ncbi:hypothetical protein [Bythopirellula goksoeyrii]|uniref:hypothetical protein n=1 Tax=Bythopirellula goksoeyrii TaxID=1400387 RepID=UPI001EE5A37D|nr:hypothetical protein [Bythopirellula goksoeyrii]
MRRDTWIPACAGMMGLLRLLAVICLIALGWLAVLPWLAEQPRMKSHLDWLEAEKIDPSAMYYTELEAMEVILHRDRQPFSRISVGERSPCTAPSVSRACRVK